MASGEAGASPFAHGVQQSPPPQVEACNSLSTMRWSSGFVVLFRDFFCPARAPNAVDDLALATVASDAKGRATHVMNKARGLVFIVDCFCLFGSNESRSTGVWIDSGMIV